MFRIFGDSPRNKTYTTLILSPILSLFSPILFHLPHNFRIENFSQLVSNFHDDEIAIVLHIEQLSVKIYVRY
jgi:hypothetical protein